MINFRFHKHLFFELYIVGAILIAHIAVIWIEEYIKSFRVNSLEIGRLKSPLQFIYYIHNARLYLKVKINQLDKFVVLKKISLNIII